MPTRPGAAHESETTSAAAPVGARAGRDFGSRGWVRPFAGLAAVVAVAAIIALAVGLFRGAFAETVSVTVISHRAGLVMNPDAKVKMNDIQVGSVAMIESRPDGAAALHLAMDRSQLHLIPSNVKVDIASSTVFGAKFVQLTPPPDPSSVPLRAGQVIEGQHVSVEINTIFEQLTSLLSAIQPEKLNQTLTALSSAFSGRGQRIGETISDLDATLALLEPSYDNLSHDIAVAPTVLNTFADVASDLLKITDRATAISRTIVEEQQALDGLLVSLIGFGEIGNDVLTTNHRPLTDVLHLLAPVTDLTREYDQAIYCALAGAIPLATVPPPRVPGAEVSASFRWGADSYRYPSDLPRVAAKGGPHCLGLPQLPFETRPPYVVADVGTNPWEYGNQGIRLNTAGLKEFLLGHPLDGPPRNSAQIGQPG